MEVYFTITNNCNLECAHCCYDAGPGKPKMSFKDIKKVIDNFHRSLEKICLSGGEVFTRKNLLYSALGYIQEKHFRNLEEVMVQTNGFWAKGKEVINKTLNELIKLGVTEIDLSSNDAYHRIAGLHMENVRTLGKILEKKGIGEIREYFSKTELRVFPIGRAKDLKKAYWGKRNRKIKHLNCKTLKQFHIAIDYKGDVYPCCWMVPGTELGNAKKEKAVKIVRRSLKNKVISTLVGRGGPESLARKAGLNKKVINEYMPYNECSLCTYLFSEGIAKI